MSSNIMGCNIIEGDCIKLLLYSIIIIYIIIILHNYCFKFIVF